MVIREIFDVISAHPNQPAYTNAIASGETWAYVQANPGEENAVQYLGGELTAQFSVANNSCQVYTSGTEADVYYLISAYAKIQTRTGIADDNYVLVQYFAGSAFINLQIDTFSNPGGATYQFATRAGGSHTWVDFPAGSIVEYIVEALPTGYGSRSTVKVDGVVFQQIDTAFPTFGGDDFSGMSVYFECDQGTNPFMSFIGDMRASISFDLPPKQPYTFEDQFDLHAPNSVIMGQTTSDGQYVWNGDVDGTVIEYAPGDNPFEYWRLTNPNSPGNGGTLWLDLPEASAPVAGFKTAVVLPGILPLAGTGNLDIFLGGLHIQVAFDGVFFNTWTVACMCDSTGGFFRQQYGLDTVVLIECQVVGALCFAKLTTVDGTQEGQFDFAQMDSSQFQVSYTPDLSGAQPVAKWAGYFNAFEELPPPTPATFNALVKTLMFFKNNTMPETARVAKGFSLQNSVNGGKRVVKDGTGRYVLKSVTYKERK